MENSSPSVLQTVGQHRPAPILRPKMLTPNNPKALTSLSDRGQERTTRLQLIDAALRASKHEFRWLYVQLGVVGHVPEIAEASEYVSRRRGLYLDCVDTFEDARPSLITAAAKRTPPTLHPRARLRSTADFTSQFAYLYVTPDGEGYLTPDVLLMIGEGTVLVARDRIVEGILPDHPAFPLYWHRDFVAVKIA
jgi:hypothetical protein